MTDQPQSVSNIEIQYDSGDRVILQSAFEASIVCIPGICLAGAVYPTVVLLISGVVIAPEMLTAIVFSLTIGGVVGGIAGILAGVVSAYLVGLSNDFIRWTNSLRDQVAITGGMAGFLATSSFLILPPSGDLIWKILVGPVLVVLAMLMGQCGAILYANQFSNLNELSNAATAQPRFQFQIRHLLFAMAVVAVAFALGRTFSNRIPAAALFYVVTQTLLIAIDTVWQRNRSRSQSHRQDQLQAQSDV